MLVCSSVVSWDWSLVWSIHLAKKTLVLIWSYIGVKFPNMTPKDHLRFLDEDPKNKPQAIKEYDLRRDHLQTISSLTPRMSSP